MSQKQHKAQLKNLVMNLIAESFKAGARHNEYENAFTWDGSAPIPDTLEQHMAKIEANFSDLLE